MIKINFFNKKDNELGVNEKLQSGTNFENLERVDTQLVV